MLIVDKYCTAVEDGLYIFNEKFYAKLKLIYIRHVYLPSHTQVLHTQVHTYCAVIAHAYTILKNAEKKNYIQSSHHHVHYSYDEYFKRNQNKGYAEIHLYAIASIRIKNRDTYTINVYIRLTCSLPSHAHITHTTGKIARTLSDVHQEEKLHGICENTS